MTVSETLSRAAAAVCIASLSLWTAGDAAAQTAQKPQAARPAPAATPAPAPAATPAPAANDGDVVARVGSRDVKVGEVRAYLAALGPREQAAVAADPSVLTQAVRNYLVNEVVLAAALARKWEQRPEVAAELERARKTALMESFLNATSQPAADYPSDADVQALYDANTTAFMAPRQFQIAQIFVAAPDKAAEDKAKARLDEVLARLKQPGADFAAALRPDGPGKEAGDRGDEIGWVAETQLRPEIREHVTGLAEGAVAPPLRLADGWHILKLVDTRPAGPRPLAEVRDQLVQRLRQERQTQLRRAVIQDLVRQTPAAINELALGRMTPASGAGVQR